MKRSLALLASLVTSPALAFYASGEPEFFRWTPPSQYVDGSPLDALTEISAYILRCTATNPAGEYEVVLPGGENSRYDVPEFTFAPGTWVCQMYAVSIAGQTSEGSAPVEVLVDDWRFRVAPRPPSALGVG